MEEGPMAGTIDPSHDRVRLSRDELRVLARLERSLAADATDAAEAAAPPDRKTGRWRRISSWFRRSDRDG
jgi:hypothetical protein